MFGHILGHILGIYCVHIPTSLIVSHTGISDSGHNTECFGWIWCFSCRNKVFKFRRTSSSSYNGHNIVIPSMVIGYTTENGNVWPLPNFPKTPEWIDWTIITRVVDRFNTRVHQLTVYNDKLLTLWCPCTKCSVKFVPAIVIACWGWDTVSINAIQSHSGEHLVAKKLYAILKYMFREKLFGTIDQVINLNFINWRYLVSEQCLGTYWGYLGTYTQDI